MSWEVAIVVSVFGTAFFFVYLSSQIDGNTFIHDGIKLLLIASAMFVLLINAALPLHLVDNLNQSGSADLSVQGFTELTNLGTTNLKVVKTVITVILWLTLLLLIIVVIDRGYMKWMRKGERGEGPIR